MVLHTEYVVVDFRKLGPTGHGGKSSASKKLWECKLVLCTPYGVQYSVYGLPLRLPFLSEYPALANRFANHGLLDLSQMHRPRKPRI